MKVIIIGKKWFGTEVLKKLSSLVDVQAVHIERNSIDLMSVTAQKLSIPVLKVLKEMPDCDLIISAGYQDYVPKSVLQHSRLGVLAYHPSLLPRHRGSDAVHWTIAMNEPVTGGTVYWMDEGVDTGPIEAQNWCHVLPGESASELWRRALAPMGVDLFVDVVKRLFYGKPPVRRLQEARFATWEPSLSVKKLSESGGCEVIPV